MSYSSILLVCWSFMCYALTTLYTLKVHTKMSYHGLKNEFVANTWSKVMASLVCLALLPFTCVEELYIFS